MMNVIHECDKFYIISTIISLKDDPIAQQFIADMAKYER
jgi:hypothetical protein